jgi:hypothetical protein
MVMNINQPDWEAGLELITFLWKASGRHPAWITPETTVLLKQYLLQHFALLAPDVQHVLFNARAYQEQLEALYNQVGPEQRFLLAQEFNTSLNSLGIYDPLQPNAGVPYANTAGAGSSEDSSLGGLAQTMAWNLAQKSSGGW